MATFIHKYNTWDDLSKVPFNDNQKSNQVNSKDTVKAARDLRNMVDSLPSNRNDKTERAIAVEKTNQQVLDNTRVWGRLVKDIAVAETFRQQSNRMVKLIITKHSLI